ncbi:MAG TPA: hypothetical protein VKZ18_01610 [Polyangia bacterium]|nr:hypothetical protein [Polyangia bacterium]
MSDEATLIVGILGGLAVMIVLLLRHQRRKEARLAAQTEIEIPIQSTAKAAGIIIVSMLPGPVLVGVLAAATDQTRQHAVAVVLLLLALSMGGVFTVGMKLARRYANVGLLRYTPARLELRIGPQRWQVDLGKPYELDEAHAFGPGNISLQVLVVRQSDGGLAFSYGLPLGRKPYGDRAVDRYVEPLVDGEARVIHDRLRTRTAR